MTDDTVFTPDGHLDVTIATDGPSREALLQQRHEAAFIRALFSALHAPANDNSIASSDSLRESDFEPLMLPLESGGTLLTWIGPEGHAHARVCGPQRDEEGNDWIAPSKYASLNAAIADLGPVAPAVEGIRRMQVVEPRAGTFAIMWLALTESSMVARGKFFAPSEGDSRANVGQDAWAESPLADVPLPGFVRNFQIAGAVADQLLVSYEAADGLQCAIVTPLLRAGRAAGPHEAGLHATASTPAYFDQALHAEVEPGSQASAAGRAHQATSSEANEATASVAEPLVTPIDTGFAVVWQTPGAADGVMELRLTLHDDQNAAKAAPDGGSVVVVSTNVAADLPPSIAGFEGGVAIAYKHADDGKLVMVAYGPDYAPRGPETVVADGATGWIRDVALATIHGEKDQLAIVYTVDDHDPTTGFGAYDYGHIMLQKYGLRSEGGSPELVTLGRDGAHDGDDEAAPLVMNSSGLEGPAVGRAPVLAALDNGDLAIVWVENDGYGETIRGGVLEFDGDQVLQLDLTSLIGDEGIANGTTPHLLDAGGGDILVSWIQHDGRGGDYAVMAALYCSIGQQAWVAPESAVRLKTFEDIPDDYAIAISHDGGRSIVLTWEEDSSGKGSGGIATQQFDLNGSELGAPKVLREGSAMPGLGQAATGLSAAGLPDGQVVVVYAEQSRRGDKDIATHVIDVGDFSSSSDKSATLARSSNQADVPNPRTGEQFATSVGEEIAVDPSGSYSNAGLSVASVNGEPISAGTPVALAEAWVQLRDDGWLTVSPNAGYVGPIEFDCLLTSPTGVETVSHVAVSVEVAAADATPFNQEVPLADNVADSSGETASISPDALSASGLDPDMFSLVGSTLYLKPNIELDFEAIVPTSGTGPQLSTGGLADSNPQETSAGTQDLMGASQADDVVDDSSASSSAYIFRRLMEEGALKQVGEDVVITLGEGDPEGPFTMVLRAASLSSLTDPGNTFS